MTLTLTVKLYLTTEQVQIINNLTSSYIDTTNQLVSLGTSGIDLKTMSSKDVIGELPSAIKNQCLRDAKSILANHYKQCRKAVLKNTYYISKGIDKVALVHKVPVLKRKCCYINNQNYRFKDNMLTFPVWLDGHSTRIIVKTSLTKEQSDVLTAYKLGTLRIVCKNHKFLAQISYEIPDLIFKEGTTIGIDIGCKCPAVSYCSNGKVKFYGNGRQNKRMRRHYRKLRHQIQKAKKIKALNRINNKEQRIMKDIDHKISHSIVNEAIRQNAGTIKLEKLTNIRKKVNTSTSKSRKNTRDINSWSFYRLANYIEYKAKLAGINVVNVNPAYTSQMCPVCGCLNHAKDRHYRCDCGFAGHRDIVGAYNICLTVPVGDSKTIRRGA